MMKGLDVERHTDRRIDVVERHQDAGGDTTAGTAEAEDDIVDPVLLDPHQGRRFTVERGGTHRLAHP